LGDALNPCHYIAEKIVAEIIENPPATAAKGGMIKPGIHAGLDELKKYRQ
jgi:DNA mismatch repair protein MutS